MTKPKELFTKKEVKEYPIQDVEHCDEYTCNTWTQQGTI
jgi:hypothetical protein